MSNNSFILILPKPKIEDPVKKELLQNPSFRIRKLENKKRKNKEKPKHKRSYEELSQE
jgi:hypothetical protein